MGLRPVVKESVQAFLECGRLTCGFARLRCPRCRGERLLAFSCRTRNFCPSCQAKRAALPLRAPRAGPRKGPAPALRVHDPEGAPRPLRPRAVPPRAPPPLRLLRSPPEPPRARGEKGRRARLRRVDPDLRRGAPVPPPRPRARDRRASRARRRVRVDRARPHRRRGALPPALRPRQQHPEDRARGLGRDRSGSVGRRRSIHTASASRRRGII